MGTGLYADMTDQEVIDEIKAYRAAIRTTAMRGVGVVAGEGRRVEFTSNNVGTAQAELRMLLTEARRRGLTIGDGSGVGIAVEIG